MEEKSNASGQSSITAISAYNAPVPTESL